MTYLFRQIRKFHDDIDYWTGLSPTESSVDQGIVRALDDGTLTAGDLDGSNIRSDLAKVPAFWPYEVKPEKYFYALPAIVVTEDVHLGNIPNVGGALEPDSQVRHFMRSATGVSSWEAYLASRAYIWNRLIRSWSYFRYSLSDNTQKVRWSNDFTAPPEPVCGPCFNVGLHFLGAALHTLQDSYAPGHVQRSGQEVIEKVHIWDTQNQNPHDGWDGHHAYDNPSNPTSQPHYYAARIATAEYTFAVLSNLDQDEGTTRTNIANALDSKLMRASMSD
jgi:hypothetical protein